MRAVVVSALFVLAALTPADALSVASNGVRPSNPLKFKDAKKEKQRASQAWRKNAPGLYKDNAYFPREGDLYDAFPMPISLNSKVWNTLPGIAFNPSLIVLPEAKAKELHPQAKFAATLRHRKGQCENLGVDATADRKRPPASSSIVILDEHFNMLATAPMEGEDIRLFLNGDDIMATYMTYEPRTHFGQFHVEGVELSTESTGSDTIKAAFGDLKLADAPAKMLLKRTRNLGLIAHNKSLDVLWWVNDASTDVRPLFTRMQGAQHHNSVHPMEIPELKAYLGVLHDHASGSAKTNDAFFGSDYKSSFFLMGHEAPYNVRSISAPFCIPSLNPAKRAAGLCETIQFIGSILRDPQDPSMLLIAYGINDCEAAIARLPVKSVMGSLKKEIAEKTKAKQSLHIKNIHEMKDMMDSDAPAEGLMGLLGR